MGTESCSRLFQSAIVLFSFSVVLCIIYVLNEGRRAGSNYTSFSTPLVLTLSSADGTDISRINTFPNTDKTQTILIVSTWRSGSSTFSGILASHKDVFLHYEPLDGHEVGSLTDPSVTSYVSNITDNLVTCNYGGIKRTTLKRMYNTRPYLEKNNKLPPKCKASRPVHPNNPCLNTTFISHQCSHYPIQMVKYVRISLLQVQHYIEQDKNYKIIWLARDPRAVWNSRQNNKMVKFWCLSGLCGDLKRLCQSYEINLQVSEALLKSHPTQFLRVQFEDMQSRPFKEADRITQFLGLQGSEQIHNKIGALMDRTNFTTKKDWRDFLSGDMRTDVEMQCSGTMPQLGYF